MRRVDGRGAAGGARIGLAVIGAALVLDGVALALDIVLGRRLLRGVEVPAASLDTSSTLSSASNLAVPLAVVAGGLAFLWWFRGAYRRLAAVGRARWAPRWSLLGWVVPGLNLVRPPSIMGELTGHSALVAPWWLLWAAGGVVHGALRLIRPATEEGWIYWLSTALAADVALLGSLGCALVLIGLAERRDAADHRRVGAVASVPARG